jgi:hypothetical protein
MFRATISQVNMEKVLEFLSYRRIWMCAYHRSAQTECTSMQRKIGAKDLK